MFKHSPSGNPALLGFVTLSAVLLIQTFHASEHVAQMVQRYVLHLNRAPGLLGAWFDLEWVHLIYNTALLVALIAVVVVYRRNPGMWRHSDLAVTMLYFVLIFQGYHTLEHVVRVSQYLQHVPIPTPGILGRLFPILELHFWFNAVVTIAILMAYLGFQPWRPFLHRPTVAAPTA
ncbi:MAG: hypothetical protein IPM84_04695 [Anaerolineae bacterium]|nr:hypothetical protein [Anaerolineae bacterium]